jgi:B12-binding domain/radical SAM domain protein of rhizo-twelve system
MRVALINPAWSFEGSIYFGCREPHLPLEFGYSKALLERAGHEAEIVDGQMDGLSAQTLAGRAAALEPDMIVVTTAPSYLFWRCPPAELRAPRETLDAMSQIPAIKVAVGPHGSTTPVSTLEKLGVDAVVMGECEEALVRLAQTPRVDWGAIKGVCLASLDGAKVNGGPLAVDMGALPPLRWPDAVIGRHRHHHHRFDDSPDAPGAEMEASRGCPYHCTFCAKDNFRDVYRRRPLAVILEELDGLIAAGVRYVYFIDEIFLPWRALLEAFAERDFAFGVQTRIDLWSFEMLDLLGQAGCVSIEAGVESLSPEGREWLDKRCKLSTDELADRLIHAKRKVAFVQANLIDAGADDTAEIARWRERLHANGVWANEPVPLFPYPGSPDYQRLWGAPDSAAWERAVDYYIDRHHRFSDIQDARPRPLSDLEAIKV